MCICICFLLRRSIVGLSLHFLSVITICSLYQMQVKEPSAAFQSLQERGLCSFPYDDPIGHSTPALPE